MTENELEEVILALKAAGIAVPNFQILDDGAVYFDYGQQEANHTGVYSQAPRSDLK